MSDPTLSQTPSPHLAAPRVRELRVVFSVDAATPSVIALRRQPVTVGREPGDDGLRLEDRRVSRVHMVVAPEGDAWYAVDQGSRNGIYVDGVKVARAPLAPGSFVRLGGTVLLLAESDGREEPGGGEGIAGPSLAMRAVRAEVRVAAPRPQSVLITGETGVGKEQVAAELHRLSRRAGAFVPVNCAAISPSLAESELFGHVAGAFTGAQKRGEGLWPAAHGGTLFLDEIGELSLDLQAKLLRALALGEVRPVGATQATALDVRVLAATNRSLDVEVGRGAFRADLLSRVAAWRIEVPPLRTRRDDILPLAQLFLARSTPTALTADAAEALLLHGWPWNVRELEQIVTIGAARAAESRSDVLGLEHLPPALRAPFGERAVAAGNEPVQDLVARDGDEPPAADELTRVLVQHGCNISAVARIYNRERRQVYRWIERHGIDLEQLRRRP